VWFVVKRRGCCCNLSGGVALIVWFTTNGMCAKNKNICMWREQAIIEWSRRVISVVACHGAKLCVHAARDFRSQQNHLKGSNKKIKNKQGWLTNNASVSFGQDGNILWKRLCFCSLRDFYPKCKGKLSNMSPQTLSKRWHQKLGHFYVV